MKKRGVSRCTATDRTTSKLGRYEKSQFRRVGWRYGHWGARDTVGLLLNEAAVFSLSHRESVRGEAGWFMTLHPH